MENVPTKANMPRLLPLHEKDFNKKHHIILLSEVQHGNLQILMDMNTLYSCHWNTVRAPKTGDTVCHIAARMGHLDIVNYLMTNWDWSPNITNNMGKTPLHEAAQFSKHEVVHHMLQYGGSPTCLKQGDWTPLMLACTKVGPDAYKTIEHLVKAKDSGLKSTNKDGWTALHIAARSGDEGVFNLLVQRYEDDSDVNEMKTRNGRSPLHIACLHGNVDIVTALLKLGADVNAKDSCGHTPLHECTVAETGGLQLLQLLVARGADTKVTSGAGLSILHLAAGHAKLDVVEYILNCMKFDPNVQSEKQGLSPLHVAARARKRDTMDLLKKYGASDTISDGFGRLPEYYFSLPFK